MLSMESPTGSIGERGETKWAFIQKKIEEGSTIGEKTNYSINRLQFLFKDLFIGFSFLSQIPRDVRSHKKDHWFHDFWIHTIEFLRNEGECLPMSFQHPREGEYTRSISQKTVKLISLTNPFLYIKETRIYSFMLTKHRLRSRCWNRNSIHILRKV